MKFVPDFRFKFITQSKSFSIRDEYIVCFAVRKRKLLEIWTTVESFHEQAYKAELASTSTFFGDVVPETYPQKNVL